MRNSSLADNRQAEEGEKKKEKIKTCNWQAAVNVVVLWSCGFWRVFWDVKWRDQSYLKRSARSGASVSSAARGETVTYTPPHHTRTGRRRGRKSSLDYCFFYWSTVRSLSPPFRPRLNTLHLHGFFWACRPRGTARCGAAAAAEDGADSSGRRGAAGRSSSSACELNKLLLVWFSSKKRS